MSKFKLLDHETFSEIVEHTYILQHEENEIVYKEWVDSGTVVDFTLKDKEGNDIGDEELLEQVMEFIDNLD